MKNPGWTGSHVLLGKNVVHHQVEFFNLDDALGIVIACSDYGKS